MDEGDERLQNKKIHFMEKKRNIIMTGDFTKILYSDEFLSLNGLFIECPIITQPINKYQNKNTIWFQPYSIQNVNVVKNFCQLERKIIEYYKTYTRCRKSPIYVLYNQLYSGNTKIYRDISEESNKIRQDNTVSLTVKYIIKISGVWESEDSFGITYKFLEYYTV